MNQPIPTGPLSRSPSFAIIGSGAVGSYYGARLVQGGQDVHFLLRSDYEAVRQNGLTIKSCAGDFDLPPDQLQLYRDARDMPQVDWVIVTLKTTNNDQFERLIHPLLKPDTAILTLQNGLGNEDRLALLFGPGRVLGGMAFTCINRQSPGLIDHSAHGLIRLGEYAGRPGARAAHIADLFNRCQIPCDVLDDLQYGRWEKLVWNIPFNGLSTILNQNTEQILATATGERLVRDIMAEVIASARANGVIMNDDLIDLNITRTREMAGYQTSMQVDRQRGRDLEIEAIIGEPLRSGIARSVANPLIRMLYALLCNVQSASNPRSVAHSPTPN